MSFLADKLSKLASDKFSKLAGVAQSFALSKWYIDTLLDDGTVLFLQVGQISMAGVRLARVAADWFRSDGYHLAGSADALRVERAGEGLSSSAAVIEGDRLKFETDTIRGDLRFAARYPRTVLRDPLYEQDGRQVRWIVEVPDADVTGKLYLNGSERVVEGRGYRDVVELEFTPWGLPFRMIRWGRAVGGPHAAMWMETATPREVISCTWKDGVAGVRIGDEVCQGVRSLFSGPVVDLDNWRLGPLSPVIRKASRDPYQEKRAGRAVLDGCAGVAVQDLVRFRA